MNTYRVYLKAQSATASSGPNFNVVPDVGAAIPSQITRTQLLSGVIIEVDQAATTLNLISVGGTCTDSFNVVIQKDPVNCLPVGDTNYPTPTATPSVTTTPTATPSVTTTPTATPEPTACPPQPSPTPWPVVIVRTTGTGGHDPFFAIAKTDISSMDGSLSDNERFFAQWEDNGQDAINEMATIVYKNIDGTDIWVFHKNRFVPSIGGCVIQYVRVWANGVEHLYSAGNMTQQNTVVQYGPLILNIAQLSSDVVSGGPYLELSINWESLPEGVESLSGGFGLVLKRASLSPDSYWQSTIGVSVDGFTEAGRPWGITRRHLEALAKLRPPSIALPEEEFPMPKPNIDRDGDGIDEDLLVNRLTESELEELLRTSINTVDSCEFTFTRLTDNNLPPRRFIVLRPDDPTPSYIIGRPRQPRTTPTPIPSTESAESIKSPISQRVQLYIDPLRLSS
jgi:hypothetical protein